MLLHVITGHWMKTHLSLTPALLAQLYTSSTSDIVTPILAHSRTCRNVKAYIKRWFAQKYDFIQLNVSFLFSHISKFYCLWWIESNSSNIMDRCNYLVPHASWIVEMPINAGPYHQTIASLWDNTRSTSFHLVKWWCDTSPPLNSVIRIRFQLNNVSSSSLYYHTWLTQWLGDHSHIQHTQTETHRHT